MLNSIPSEFQALLPSASVNNLDAKQDKTYIIEALLKKSTWQGWQWMLSQYTKKDIVKVIHASRLLSPKDVMLWIHHYNLNPQDIACLQPKSHQIHSNSWAY